VKKIIGGLLIVLFILAGCASTTTNSNFIKYERNNEFSIIENSEDANQVSTSNEKSIFVCYVSGSKLIPDALARELVVVSIDEKLIHALKSNGEAVHIKLNDKDSAKEIKFFFIENDFIDKRKYVQYWLFKHLNNEYFIVSLKDETWSKQNRTDSIINALFGRVSMKYAYYPMATNGEDYKKTCEKKQVHIKQSN